MTVKINELVIRAKVEKKREAADASSVSTNTKSNATIEKPAELVSLNKLNRER